MISCLYQKLIVVGFEFDCTLVEPQSCMLAANGDHRSVQGDCSAQPQLPLMSQQVRYLLQCSAKFLEWKNPQLIDVEHLCTTFDLYLISLMDLSPMGIKKLLTRTRLPMDVVALLFAALALGSQHSVWDNSGGQWIAGAVEKESQSGNVYSEFHELGHELQATD